MGRQTTHGVSRIAAFSITCALAALGAPTASALEYEEVPAEVKPAPIVARHLNERNSPTTTPGRRTFSFAVQTGYCVGDPKPRIDHVRVIERPKTADRPFKSSVITAFLLHPARLRTIPPSPPPPKVIYNVCAGLGLSLMKRIRLKRPAADLFFFDGSYPHPHRVWPLK